MRKHPDFIKAYMQHTADQESPDVYHFWTALGIMAAAIRMNISLNRGYYDIYPNMYTIFIGESGRTRKSTAQEYGVDKILREVPGLKIFSERMTMEGIMLQMDTMSASAGGMIQRDGCVFLSAPELMMMMPGDEISRKVMGFMTSVYMGKKKYNAPLTSGGGFKPLENVLINFLGASAPDWLETISEDAAKGGFLARIVFITAEKARFRRSWPSPQGTGIELGDLIHDLITISTLKGEMKPTPALLKTFDVWYCEDQFQSDDPRVQGFKEREHDLALRIAMLLSVATSDDLILDEPHLILAKTILKDIEGYIPRALTHIATSPASRDAERILAMIKRKGGKMTYTEILRANSWKLSAQELQQIMQTLEEREEIWHQRTGRQVQWNVGRKP